MNEVKKLIEKSEDTLQDAEKAYQQEMLLSTVQNRIYYSLYYAAQAALISLGYDIGTHEGVKIKIGEEMVLEGLLDKKWGRFYSQQQTYREQADYQLDVDIERDDLEEFIEDSRRFIEQMKEIIE